MKIPLALKISMFAAPLIAAGAADALSQSVPKAMKTPGGQSKNDTLPKPKPSAWTLTTPLGFHEESTIDTLQYNYQRQTIPSMVSDAYACTSNMGGEGINLIYFERPSRGDFFFADALSPWVPSIRKQKFYNVYTPMTLVSYNYGGGSDTHQDRVKGEFAGNVNRNIGIGAFADYIHSKGCYANLAVKNFSFGGTVYYTGSRYEMQAMYQQYNSLNRENGGITDPGYIIDPAALQGGVSKIETTSIPVRLSNAFNRLTGARLFTTHAYKLGYWHDVEVNDTLVRPEFVAHTKILYSFEYTHDRHAFRDFSATETQDFWGHSYLNPEYTSDVTTLDTYTNTIGVSMIEGFQKWAKFGIGAYASVDHRRYSLPSATDPQYAWPAGADGLTPLPADIQNIPRHDETILWVGGRLEKTRGSILRYDADARFGLSGDYAGDMDIKGGITTRIPLWRDTLSVSARGHFKNATPSWLLQHYVSNHFAWSNNFSRTNSFRVGGTVSYPKSGTTISAGFENIRNLIYFNDKSLPAQAGSPVSLFTASIDQRLNLGILHWDNRITYQETSDSRVLPLPKLSVYSNLYLQFTAFRVLHLQIGADCDYYTQYCGLAYQPALMTFHTQQHTNLGDYAFCNAYINAKLYQARFYVMVSHVNQGWFGNNYFSLPGYPANPRRIMLGLSVDFAN